MSRNFKVLIIGAGAAGYAAACRFLEKGFTNFLILEASNRIGGRINSVSFGDGIVELGAQWCHGEEGNIVYNQTKDLNILKPSTPDYTYFTFVDSKGTFINRDESEYLQDLLESITDNKEDMLTFPGSLGEYVNSRFWDKLCTKETNQIVASGILDWFHKFECSLNGSSSLWEVSCSGATYYEPCAGNHTLNWNNYGYSTLFSVLDKSYPDPTKALPISERILFNKEVKQVKIQDPTTTVICDDNSEYKADHVIVTMSLGVLKNNHETMFVPKLPASKKATIEGLSICTVNKIFLEFPEKWWPEDSIGWSFIWQPEDSGKTLYDRFPHGPFTEDGHSWLESIFGFYPVDDNPRVLLGWLVGPLAPQVELLPDRLILEGCAFLLNTFLGEKLAPPRPKSVLCSRWGTNPFFQGSYSHRGIHAERLQASAAELAAPVEGNKLLFAGEATHPNLFSTVHGAVESGIREADRVLALQRNNITSNRCRIAIVGAGLAGLAAAHELLDSGCNDFIILEAKDRPGGRVHTMELENGHLDLGAQWLHGNLTTLWSIAKYHGLLAKGAPVYEGLGQHLQQDGHSVKTDIVERMAQFIETTLEDCEKWKHRDSGWPKSIGDCLDENFKLFIKQVEREGASKEDLSAYEDLFDWHVRFHLIDNACDDLYKLSARAWGLYDFPTSDAEYSHVSLENGLNKLIDVLCRRLPPGRLLLNKPVDKVQWGDDHRENRAYLCCADGSEVVSDGVIFTASLGVLKEHADTMFEPALPQNVLRAINLLGYGSICKIFLQFEECWWQDGGIQLLWPRSAPYADDWTRYMTGFDPVYGRSDTLVGWVGDGGVALVEALSEDEVGRQCTQLLLNFTKLDSIPELKKTVRTSWHSDRWIRGAYSHTTNACDLAGVNAEDLRYPATDDSGRPVIVLAGEACHQMHFSTLHGAYTSGREQARLLWSGMGPVIPHAKM